MHHQFEGCACKHCGKRYVYAKDHDHDWDACRCRKCGEGRRGYHNWERDRCQVCGMVCHHIQIVHGACADCEACFCCDPKSIKRCEPDCPFCGGSGRQEGILCVRTQIHSFGPSGSTTSSKLQSWRLHYSFLRTSKPHLLPKRRLSQLEAYEKTSPIRRVKLSEIDADGEELRRLLFGGGGLWGPYENLKAAKQEADHILTKYATMSKSWFRGDEDATISFGGA